MMKHDHCLNCQYLHDCLITAQRYFRNHEKKLQMIGIKLNNFLLHNLPSCRGVFPYLSLISTIAFFSNNSFTISELFPNVAINQITAKNYENFNNTKFYLKPSCKGALPSSSLISICRSP